MGSLGLILALSVLVGSLPGVIDQFHRDRAGVWKTLRLFSVYLVLVFANIGVMLWLLSGPPPSRRPVRPCRHLLCRLLAYAHRAALS